MFGVPNLALSWRFVLVLTAVLAADQATKSWALSTLFETGKQIVIAPFFNFTPVSFQSELFTLQPPLFGGSGLVYQ